jgi:hypothetical protein
VVDAQNPKSGAELREWYHARLTHYKQTRLAVLRSGAADSLQCMPFAAPAWLFAPKTTYGVPFPSTTVR